LTGIFLFKRNKKVEIKKDYVVFLNRNSLNNLIPNRMMKMKKTGVLLAMASMSLAACSQKEGSTGDITTKEAETSAAAPVELIGKKGILTYPDFTAYMTYESENRLHWKTVTKEGKIAEGEEELSYKRINDHIFFLSWIEADGFTVSQVIDVNTGKVEAFLSFSDDQSTRGKRNFLATAATFTFEE